MVMIAELQVIFSLITLVGLEGTCIETATCSLNPDGQGVLGWLQQPILLTLGDFAFPLVWGLVVGIYYRRTGNMMYAGFMGVFLMAAMNAGNAILVAQQAFYIGWIMLAVAIGFTLYVVWKVRLHNPAA